MDNGYKRLPGRYWVLFSANSLWLGADHILAVYSNFFSQNYKRFYFKDIQRITVRKTKTYMIWNGIWGGLAFMSAQLLWSGWSPIPIIFFVFFLLCLLLNWLRGPNCWCHIQTAVQTEKLPALHHWRTAVKALNEIRPFIETAQNLLFVENFREHARNPEQETPSSLIQTETRELIHHEKGFLHFFIFIFFLMGSFEKFAGFTGIFEISSYVKYIFILFIFSLFIVALIRQRNSDLGVIYRGLTWVTFSYIGLFIIWEFFSHVFLRIKNEVSGFHPEDLRMIVDINMLFIYASILFGAIGTITFMVLLFKIYIFKTKDRSSVL